MKLPEADLVAVDTETTGLFPDDGARVAVVSAAWEGGSCAWAFDQGIRDKRPTEQLTLEGEADPNLGQAEWEQLCEWLRTREAIVYHNAKFDLALLRAGTRHWPGVDLAHNFHWDSLLASRVLDPKHSASLDSCAKRIGIEGKSGLDEIKAWLRSHRFPTSRYDLAPWSLVEPYADRDAVMTLEVFREQRGRAWGREKDRIDREFRLLLTLLDMESRGIGYDAEESLRAAEILEDRATVIARRLPFEATPNGAKAYFFGEKGLTPARTTEKGAPSLDEEQVRLWVGQGIEWAEEYAQVTRLRRAVSMWYRGYPEKIGPDGRLRTSYKQAFVKSGRMSVERVQLQALPKADKYRDIKTGERLAIYEGIPEVRSLLRPAEGMGLWNLDLSQAELRVATKFAQCQRMATMLAEGADAHGETCRGVIRVEPDDPSWKAKRDIAKRLNFGGIFMIGGKKFQATLAKLADIHLPLEECEQYVRTWRNIYPEFGQAYRRAEQMAKRKGYVQLLPGTEYEIRSYFGERDYPNTAWNRIVQGSLAEFFKLWMVETEKLAPGRMILTVHDSVVLEAPLDEGDGIAELVAERGAEMATEIFKTEMLVDTDRW